VSKAAEAAGLRYWCPHLKEDDLGWTMQVSAYAFVRVWFDFIPPPKDSILWRFCPVCGKERPDGPH
jgi:hypothetical protein